MSLQASLGKYRTDLSEAAARTFRPPGNAAARSTTSTATARPKPAASTPAPAADSAKRSHDTAFNEPLASGSAGSELLTQVHLLSDKLKAELKKGNGILAFDALIQYLSLPMDQEKSIPFIRRAMIDHPQFEHFTASRSGIGQEAFKYRPQHPVTNGDELKLYLQKQPTAQGIAVRELKDGWPDCNEVINELEKEGWVLVIRNKKDNTPRWVWKDGPDWHVDISSDFRDYVLRAQMPASDGDMRTELEKAGLTVSSQIKERKNDLKKKERKKPNRRGGKTTNSHMAGILKDYSR